VRRGRRGKIEKEGRQRGGGAGRKSYLSISACGNGRRVWNAGRLRVEKNNEKIKRNVVILMGEKIIIKCLKNYRIGMPRVSTAGTWMHHEVRKVLSERDTS